jgi:hypothetical protein
MNKKRESRYERIARFALSIARASLPKYSHPKSPKIYTLPQVAACVMLKFYLNLSYRDTEEWLLSSDKVCQVLGLEERVPDFSTLERTAKKLTLRHIEAMQQWLLGQVGMEPETWIAIDGTGYSPSQASWYYLSRSQQQRRYWLKGVYAVGCESQFILAVRTERGPSSDVRALKPFRYAVKRYASPSGWVFLGDKGCDGRAVRGGDLIPPMRRHNNITDPDRLARRDLLDAARLDGIYGQRWKCETVNSVIKRRFGDHIASRLPRLQWREPHWKALVYNLHR